MRKWYEIYERACSPQTVPFVITRITFYIFSKIMGIFRASFPYHRQVPLCMESSFWEIISWSIYCVTCVIVKMVEIFHFYSVNHMHQTNMRIWEIYIYHYVHFSKFCKVAFIQRLRCLHNLYFSHSTTGKQQFYRKTKRFRSINAYWQRHQFFCFNWYDEQVPTLSLPCDFNVWSI